MSGAGLRIVAPEIRIVTVDEERGREQEKKGCPDEVIPDDQLGPRLALHETQAEVVEKGRDIHHASIDHLSPKKGLGLVGRGIDHKKTEQPGEHPDAHEPEREVDGRPGILQGDPEAGGKDEAADYQRGDRMHGRALADREGKVDRYHDRGQQDPPREALVDHHRDVHQPEPDDGIRDHDRIDRDEDRPIRRDLNSVPERKVGGASAVADQGRGQKVEILVALEPGPLPIRLGQEVDRIACIGGKRGQVHMKHRAWCRPIGERHLRADPGYKPAGEVGENE